MNNFKIIPLDNFCIANRKPLHGVGINDADYQVSPTINGKKEKCPAYTRWADMIRRCYCVKFKENKPTYKDCYVCKEWLTFSNFSKWFYDNYVEGYDLDKDIKNKGNKCYSPDTCLFLPPKINTLLTNCKEKTRNLPVGVHFNKERNEFRSTIRIDGKMKSLGAFDDIDEAKDAYSKQKNIEIKKRMSEYPDLADYLVKFLIVL